MRTKMILTTVLIFLAMIIHAQQDCVERYLKTDPGQIPAADAGWQQYDFSLKWRNLDLMSGAQLSCNGLKAVYRFHPQDHHVVWEDVILGNLQEFRRENWDGKELSSLNNFEYHLTDMSFMSGGFYQNVEAAIRELAGWMASDAAQMYGMGRLFFDSLSFANPVYPEYFENRNLEFQNWYIFKSKGLKMLWTGVTLVNSEICAIVRFESLNNPVGIDHGDMKMKGRSLYWGEMNISLKDKEIEQFSMVEDVILKVGSNDAGSSQLINTQREVVFNKMP